MAGFARALVALVLATPGLAHADVKACVEAHASGQREAKAGHLKLADERFTACASTLACPAAIQTECAQFLRDVERSLPTVVLTAHDALGHDVEQARVYAGDELLTDRLDGRAIAIDPGAHSFRFVFADGEVSTELSIKQGERNRKISVAAPAAPLARPEPAERRPLSPPFWIASGVGVAGLASWGVFALLGHGRQTAVEACSPRCSESARTDYDAMRRDYLVADVSLGVGLAAAGVATWLWLDRPRASDARAQQGDRPRFALVPTLAPTKVELALRATTF
jgi:hypothetical protein